LPLPAGKHDARMQEKITTKEAIEILRKHQEWRRGDDADALNPKVIGRAIDAILAHFDGLAEAAWQQSKKLGPAGRSARARAGGIAKSRAKKQAVEG
jgi:hypothetical protein